MNDKQPLFESKPQENTMGFDASKNVKAEGLRFETSKDLVIPVNSSPAMEMRMTESKIRDEFGLDEAEVDEEADIIDIVPTEEMTFSVDLFTRMAFLPSCVRTWKELGYLLAWQALGNASSHRVNNTIVLMDKKKGHPCEEAKNEERKKACFSPLSHFPSYPPHTQKNGNTRKGYKECGFLLLENVCAEIRKD